MAPTRPNPSPRFFTRPSERRLAVLHFIRQAGTLALTLEEINDVLDLRRRGEQPGERVTGILDAQLVEIARRPIDLRRSRPPARRGGHDVVACRIIGNAPAEPVRP